MSYTMRIGDINDIRMNVAATDRYFNEGVCYASLFTYSTATKEIIKLINKKVEIRCNCSWYKTTPNSYHVISTKIPNSDFYHTIIYKKDRMIEDIGQKKLILFIFREVDVDSHDEFSEIMDNIYNGIEDDYNFSEELKDAVYYKLYKNSSIPILKEWINYIINSLIRNRYMYTMNILSSDDDNNDKKLIGYTICCPVDYLINLISTGLKTKVISINGTNLASEPMQAIEGLDGYLNTYSEVLADRIQKGFTPRFTPNKDKYSKELIDYANYVEYSRNIKLYPAQKDVIQSISNCLDNQKSSFIIGECGVGKTALAIGSILVNSKHKKKCLNIVMCPSHLVYKWKYEISTLAPLSEVYIVDSISTLLILMPKLKSNKRNRHIWLIISKETAKLSYEERPAAVWSKRKHCYVCPSCHQPLYTLTWEGRGRNKRPIQHFMKETAFLKQIASNRKCMNTIQKWNTEKNKNEKVDCNCKLWEPFIKTNEHDISDWIKLGKQGWIEKQHIPKVYYELSNKRKLTKEESSLYSALFNVVGMMEVGTFPIQRSPRKYSIAKYIHRYLKHHIDYVVFDEMHQLKAGDSAQGEAFGDLASVARKVIGLTGTLLNGYASGIFYILYRTFAQTMKKEGFEYNNENKFTQEYGVVKKTSNYRWESGIQKNKIGTTRIKTLPGVSPLVFTKFLLENAAFINQEDISTGLPGYTEIPIAVDMDEELSASYNKLEKDIRENMGNWRKSVKTMGQIITTLSVYPDQPYNQADIIHPDTGEIIATPDTLEQRYRNKEDTFLKLVQSKVEAGEKVLVYYHWTNRTDLANRLPKLLKEHGIKSTVLKANIKASEREEWIHTQLKNGIDVLLCNPTLIETGLDLLDFTTIIYYQMGYNLYTMRQASRRSWRLSQNKDVEVYFLYYKGTIQEQALSLMATKLQAAMAIEGKFSEEGLNALSNNEDIFTQIASSVTEGIKDSVDIQVFKKISVKNTKEKNVDKQVKVKPLQYLLFNFNNASKPNKTQNDIQYNMTDSLSCTTQLFNLC